MAAMASPLRYSKAMKRRSLLKIILILAGTLILTQCRPPTPGAHLTFLSHDSCRPWHRTSSRGLAIPW